MDKQEVIVLTIVSSLALFGGIATANAELRHIGIDFSDSCISIISANDTETCSNPEFVKSLYPEPKLKPNYQKMLDDLNNSEKTPYQKTNFLENHKQACIQKDYCNIFELSKKGTTLYWYDMGDLSRNYLDHNILIHPNILHKNPDFSKNQIIDNGTNRHWETNLNQIHISNCRDVTYDPLILWKELGWVIHYLANDCTNEVHLGKLNTPYTQELDKHNLDITTSPNWQYSQQLEELKKKYKENRIGKD